MDDHTALERLLTSDDPSVRYKARVGISGESVTGAALRSLQDEMRVSERVRALLSERQADGTILIHPYNKWRDAHWVLAQLCDLGYPSGDESLWPLVNQACNWSLACAPRVIDGRVRRCVSQQGYTLLYLIRLGLVDERCKELASRLIAWQWPDGGWNCDKRPGAKCSSVHETLLPFRALDAYARLTGNSAAASAADRAAEFFLERRLMWRKTTGEPIRPRFLLLSYPYYYHYGLLAVLRAMLDAGRLCDPRCRDARDVLELKRAPDGMFPLECKHYEP